MVDLPLRFFFALMLAVGSGLTVALEKWAPLHSSCMNECRVCRSSFFSFPFFSPFVLAWSTVHCVCQFPHWYSLCCPNNNVLQLKYKFCFFFFSLIGKNHSNTNENFIKRTLEANTRLSSLRIGREYGKTNNNNNKIVLKQLLSETKGDLSTHDRLETRQRGDT